MITAGTKLRFRDGDGGIVTVGGQVTIETLEDPPRRFTRSEHEVVVIGDESVFGPVPGVER